MSTPAGQKIVTSNPLSVENCFSISCPRLSPPMAALRGESAGLRGSGADQGCETAPHSVCVFPLKVEGTPPDYRVSDFSFFTFLVSFSGSHVRIIISGVQVTNQTHSY